MEFTYAIGDIHGEIQLLERLLKQITADETDTFVFLGDYVDRGENSAAVIKFLLEFSKEHSACVFLRGNHEDAWLEEWDGVHFLKPPVIPGGLKTWNDFGGIMPTEVGNFMANTKIDYEDDYAYYVHAGVDPRKSIWETSNDLKLWGDSDFLKSRFNWGKLIVFGHWEFPEPLLQTNKIGIDTAAYRSGILTAIRLPDRKIIQVRK